MNPENKGKNSKSDKSTQTNQSVCKNSNKPDGRPSQSLPLPRDISYAARGPITTFEFCKVFQPADDTCGLTIVHEQITEEEVEPKNSEIEKKRYRYCKEILKPYLKNYPPDCPDLTENFIKGAIESADVEIPDQQPCFAFEGFKITGLDPNALLKHSSEGSPTPNNNFQGPKDLTDAIQSPRESKDTKDIQNTTDSIHTEYNKYSQNKDLKHTNDNTSAKTQSQSGEESTDPKKSERNKTFFSICNSFKDLSTDKVNSPNPDSISSSTKLTEKKKSDHSNKTECQLREASESIKKFCSETKSISNKANSSPKLDTKTCNNSNTSSKKEPETRKTGEPIFCDKDKSKLLNKKDGNLESESTFKIDAELFHVTATNKLKTGSKITYNASKNSEKSDISANTDSDIRTSQCELSCFSIILSRVCALNDSDRCGGSFKLETENINDKNSDNKVQGDAKNKKHLDLDQQFQSDSSNNKKTDFCSKMPIMSDSDLCDMTKSDSIIENNLNFTKNVSNHSIKCESKLSKCMRESRESREKSRFCPPFEDLSTQKTKSANPVSEDTKTSKGPPSSSCTPLKSSPKAKFDKGECKQFCSPFGTLNTSKTKMCNPDDGNEASDKDQSKCMRRSKESKEMGRFCPPFENLSSHKTKSVNPISKDSKTSDSPPESSCSFLPSKNLSKAKSDKCDDKGEYKQSCSLFEAFDTSKMCDSEKTKSSNLIPKQSPSGVKTKLEENECIPVTRRKIETFVCPEQQTVYTVITSMLCSSCDNRSKKSSIKSSSSKESTKSNDCEKTLSTTISTDSPKNGEQSAKGDNTPVCLPKLVETPSKPENISKPSLGSQEFKKAGTDKSCVPIKGNTEQEAKVLTPPDEYEQIKQNMLDAHCKTMATIKVAAEDVFCKVATKTREMCEDPNSADKLRQSAEDLFNEIKKKTSEICADVPPEHNPATVYQQIIEKTKNFCKTTQDTVSGYFNHDEKCTPKPKTKTVSNSLPGSIKGFDLSEDNNKETEDDDGESKGTLASVIETCTKQLNERLRRFTFGMDETNSNYDIPTPRESTPNKLSLSDMDIDMPESVNFGLFSSIKDKIFSIFHDSNEDKVLLSTPSERTLSVERNSKEDSDLDEAEP